MISEEVNPLPDTLTIPCYACEVRVASHVRRLKVGELAVQVCLCAQCIQMDTQHLLNSTLGIDQPKETGARHLPHRDLGHNP